MTVAADDRAWNEIRCSAVSQPLDQVDLWLRGGRPPLPSLSQRWLAGRRLHLGEFDIPGQLAPCPAPRVHYCSLFTQREQSDLVNSNLRSLKLIRQRKWAEPPRSAHAHWLES